MTYGIGRYRYELVDEWARVPDGWSFNDVSGLCVDSQDRVYALNRGDHPIAVFDRDGNACTSWGQDYFIRAHGAYAAIDGCVFFTDDGHHTVSKFTSTGDLVMVLGTKDQPSDTGYERKPNFFHSLVTIARGAGPFNRPTGVSLSPSGEIYVSDGYGNARVHKFSKDGTLLLSWGEPGYGPGQFMLPHAVHVDKRDRVWVVDRENSRIQIFAPDGQFLDSWTDLCRPTDLCMDDEGVVYISELSPARVSIFSPEGNLITRWGNEGHRDRGLFLAPHDIAIDSRGDIYVGDVSKAGFDVDRGTRSLRKFARVC